MRTIIFIVFGILLLIIEVKAEIITLNKCYLNNEKSSLNYFLSKEELKDSYSHLPKDSSWNSKSWEKYRIDKGYKDDFLSAKDNLPEAMSEMEFLQNTVFNNKNRNAFFKKYKLEYSVPRLKDSGIKIIPEKNLVNYYINFEDEYIDHITKDYQARKKWKDYYDKKKIELTGKVYFIQKPFTEKNYSYNVKIQSLIGNVVSLNEEKNPPMWHPELNEYLHWNSWVAELSKLTKTGKTAVVSRNIDLKKKSYQEVVNSTIYGNPAPNFQEKYRNEVTTYEFLCTAPGSRSGTARYLDYWWAIVLIGAVIFFIYTQTGRELKIKK